MRLRFRSKNIGTLKGKSTANKEYQILQEKNKNSCDHTKTSIAPMTKLCQPTKKKDYRKQLETEKVAPRSSFEMIGNVGAGNGVV